MNVLVKSSDLKIYVLPTSRVPDWRARRACITVEGIDAEGYPACRRLSRRSRGKIRGP